MKEEKLREKYPNIKSEEDFEKLHQMLRNRNKEIIAVVCALALYLLGAGLYTINVVIAVICFVVGFALGAFGMVHWGGEVNEFFLAVARRKKVENRIVLNQEMIKKSLKKFAIKQLIGDLLTSVFVGFLCMIVWGLFLLILDEGDTEIPVLVFFVIIPLIAFCIARIGAVIKRKSTKTSEYMLFCSKILSRQAVGSSDPESNSENYYFTFRCGKYGWIDYEIDSDRYHAAFVNKDEYYLVVVKKRFSKKHKIIDIFSTEEYTLSPALERMLE